jgi:hypothetical protein
MEANPLLAALDLAHVNRMKLRFLRQFFLTQTGFDAVVPNGLTKNLQFRSCPRHRDLAEHHETPTTTPNMGVFFACIEMAGRLKMATVNAGLCLLCLFGGFRAVETGMGETFGN